MQKLKNMEKFYFLRKRSAAASILPLYCSRRQTYRKLSYSEKWIHFIPVVLLICMIILWWSSCSESLVLNKRERLMTVRGVEKPKSINETRVDFALLAKSAAVAKPPYASINSRMNPVGNQSVAAVPAIATQNH